MARLKGFAKLTKVEDALKVFFSELKPKTLESETIPVPDSLQRALAKDIIAPIDFPSFDRSTVDGYAVRASDTFGASEFSPRVLRLTNKDRISSGEATRIWTGYPIPEGADATVMLEYARESEGKVEILASVAPGTNVSKRGEDVKKSEVVLKKGLRIRPQDIGLLAALGYTKVKVVRRPRVGILSTGDELVELGSEVGKGKIIDVNRPITSSMIMELGGIPVDLGIAKDDVNEISQRISMGLKQADVVVVTGGASVGYTDLVPIAINRLGKPGVIVHGIAMRPGKPTALAIVNRKPIMLLPGNPVAAMFSFETFVRPLLLKMLGIEEEPRPTMKAKLTRRVASALGTRVFLRVRTYGKEGEFYAEPVSARGAGLITTMTKADGYVIIPEDRDCLEKGEIVIVRLFSLRG